MAHGDGHHETRAGDVLSSLASRNLDARSRTNGLLSAGAGH
jgi:hypothetical protein